MTSDFSQYVNHSIKCINGKNTSHTSNNADHLGIFFSIPNNWTQKNSSIFQIIEYAGCLCYHYIPTSSVRPHYYIRSSILFRLLYLLSFSVMFVNNDGKKVKVDGSRYYCTTFCNLITASWKSIESLEIIQYARLCCSSVTVVWWHLSIWAARKVSRIQFCEGNWSLVNFSSIILMFCKQF